MLPDLAGEAARRFGARPAFSGGGVTLGFDDLDRVSDEVAAGLARRGVGPGDVVALVLPTAVEYPLCYLAAAKLGAVTAGVNTRLPPLQQAALLERVAPALTIAAAPSELPDDGRSVVLAPAATPEAVLAELRVPGGRPPRVRRDRDAPVAVVFTSGTTGTPKGAVFAERQLDAVRAVDVGAQWGAGGATLLGTSLAHLGFMTKLPGALQSGRTTHLLRSWQAATALRATAELRLSTLSGVPTQLALVLAEPELDRVDLSALRRVLVGGGPASPPLVRAARERLGVPVVTRYSCTEAGVGCGTHPGDPPEDAETTVGRPQPGVELAVRDADGADRGVGQVGEVLLRSAAVMSGYWRDPAATAAVMSPDGFVRTGDLGYVDDLGRLHLVGRTAERYVRGGYNVSPVAVEAVLAGHPGVAQVAVVAAPDDVMGEVGVAVVVPRPAAPTLEDLRAFAATALARHELPEGLLLVDALPLTAGDKLDRAALAHQVRAARARGGLVKGPAPG